MQIQTLYPVSPLLEKHIAYYYLLKSNTTSYNNSYYSFPNTLQSLNIHKNVDCDIKTHAVSVYGVPMHNYISIVQGRYNLPLLVNLKGRIDKVTIIFKPLGLNHFIDRACGDVAGDTSQIFSEWNEDGNYIGFLELFYKTDNPLERVALLEDFLLSKYHEFNEYQVLQKAIELLTDFDQEYSIEKIAQSISMNVRSFNRLFNKHLGTTPITFKRIAKFRHSLKNKLFGEHFKSLTEIGYESNFYDQSYFIKMYRKLTGDNPSSFFNSIEKLADNQLIFKFINK